MIAGKCRHCGKAIWRSRQGIWGARAPDDPHPWYCGASPDEDKRHDPAWESQPMKARQLGRYVCAVPGGCLHSPEITISSGGVWIREGGGQWVSAHRDCSEARREPAQEGAER